MKWHISQNYQLSHAFTNAPMLSAWLGIIQLAAAMRQFCSHGLAHAPAVPTANPFVSQNNCAQEDLTYYPTSQKAQRDCPQRCVRRDVLCHATTEQRSSMQDRERRGLEFQLERNAVRKFREGHYDRIAQTVTEQVLIGRPSACCHRLCLRPLMSCWSA